MDHLKSHALITFASWKTRINLRECSELSNVIKNISTSKTLISYRGKKTLIFGRKVGNRFFLSGKISKRTLYWMWKTSNGLRAEIKHVNFLREKIGKSPKLKTTTRPKFRLSRQNISTPISMRKVGHCWALTSAESSGTFLASESGINFGIN